MFHWAPRFTVILHWSSLKRTCCFNYTGGEADWAIDTMWWRYHCYTVLLDTRLSTGIVCCSQSSLQNLLFFLVCVCVVFKRRTTIESLYVPASLTVNADISGSLWGWASTSVPGLFPEHNICPRCFWHRPASFFLPLHPWSHAPNSFSGKLGLNACNCVFCESRYRHPACSKVLARIGLNSKLYSHGKCEDFF